MPGKFILFRAALIAVFFMCLSITAASELHAKDTITWVDDNLAPAFIHEGPDKGNGLVDGVVEIYKKNLPDYDHNHLVANMPRILHMMREGEKACYAGFFKTPEREKFVAFSLPNLLALGNGIVISKARTAEIAGNDAHTSLEALLENANLHPGITRGRSYGNAIDKLVNNRIKTGNSMIQRAGTDSFSGLLRMVAERRIDYTIGFPWEVPFIAIQAKLDHEFSVIPIKETENQQWFFNYIGCPKNEWGEGVINEINNMLLDTRGTEEHMYHQTKWYPENLENEVRKAFSELILTVTE